MKLAMIVWIVAFLIGVAFGKWDDQHGREVGESHGAWIRAHILNRPTTPTNSEERL